MILQFIKHLRPKSREVPVHKCPLQENKAKWRLLRKDQTHPAVAGSLRSKSVTKDYNKGSLASARALYKAGGEAQPLQLCTSLRGLNEGKRTPSFPQDRERYKVGQSLSRSRRSKKGLKNGRICRSFAVAPPEEFNRSRARAFIDNCNNRHFGR